MYVCSYDYKEFFITKNFIISLEQQYLMENTLFLVFKLHVRLFSLQKYNSAEKKNIKLKFFVRLKYFHIYFCVLNTTCSYSADFFLYFSEY